LADRDLLKPAVAKGKLLLDKSKRGYYAVMTGEHAAVHCMVI
jgi:hypothetical protein